MRPDTDSLTEIISRIEENRPLPGDLPALRALLHPRAPAAAEQGHCSQPIDLVGRAGPANPSDWHCRELARLLDSPLARQPGSTARIAYHARWILRIAAPQDPRWRPLVSVVLPVFNRATMVTEAIDSALAQTHHPVEVIVVDDGSSDDLTTALAPYGDRIRLLRQPNRGVASARNHGLSIARGDYIHFLDSDNLLSQGFLEASLAAFWAIADAELCYAAANENAVSARVPLYGRTAHLPACMLPLNGGGDCPSSDLMAVVTSRHPFLMVGVLLPRWLALEAGGFDERLRRGEDTRFWFLLGLRGTKVIGLRQRMNLRRRLPTGLSATRTPADQHRFHLLNLADLIGRPDLWPLAPPMLNALHDADGWHLLEHAHDNTLIAEARDRLLAQLDQLVAIGQPLGLSPRPLLLCLQQFAASLHHLLAVEPGTLPFAARLHQTATNALAAAPPSSGHDLRHWLPLAGPSPAAADSLLILLLMARSHWWAAASPEAPFWSDLRGAVSTLAGSQAPGSALSEGIVGRPAPLPPLPWHLQALEACCPAPPSPCTAERIAYHADWLLSLLASPTSSGAQGPLVTVVIPVYNRADTIAEAVASALAQTYPAIEILVIDDGSSDCLEQALAPFAHRIRLLRQANRGAAAARNLGILQARGTLLHFLDADDLLEPTAIARKLEALRAIPDGELVFSGARQSGQAAQEIGQPQRYLNPPTGLPGCPTHDLMEVVAVRYPFLTSTVLLPRWVLHQVGLFDPALRRGEDSELFFRLGLRGTKAIAIDGMPTYRRISHRSLSASVPSATQQALSRGTRLLRLMSSPPHRVRHVRSVLLEILRPGLAEILASSDEPAVACLRERILFAVRRIARAALVRRSPRDFLHSLGQALEQGCARCPGFQQSQFYGDLHGAIAAGARRRRVRPGTKAASDAAT